jgi:hypothetical protein
MKKNKIFGFICTAIMLFAGSSFAQKSTKPLDGLNYEIKITVEAQAKPTKPLADDITFKNNTNCYPTDFEGVKVYIFYP